MEMEADFSGKCGYVKSKIDIIYNAEKAKQHKQEIDNTIIKLQKQAKKRSIIKGGLMMCMIISFFIAFIKQDSLCNIFALSTLCATGIYFIVTGFHEYLCEPNNDYPADVEYYMATENKKILSIKIIPFFDYLNVEIITENTNNSINKTKLNFKVIEKTNINHIILDVNEKTVYVPYEK